MGYNLLARLAEDLAEVSMVEFAPKQDGRNMVMVLAPNRRKSEAVRAKQVARDKTDKTSDTE
jgi:translation initiation factor IF-3